MASTVELMRAYRAKWAENLRVANVPGEYSDDEITRTSREACAALDAALGAEDDGPDALRVLVEWLAETLEDNGAEDHEGELVIRAARRLARLVGVIKAKSALEELKRAWARATVEEREEFLGWVER